jgi:hypothetical protein
VTEAESVRTLILRSIGEADASRRMAAKYGFVAILRDAAQGARLLRMRAGIDLTLSG